jgi:hypothetical protein
MNIDRYPKYGEGFDPLRPPYDPLDYAEQDGAPARVENDEYPTRGLGPDPVRGSRADVSGPTSAEADGRTAIGWGYHDGRTGI